MIGLIQHNSTYNIKRIRHLKYYTRDEGPLNGRSSSYAFVSRPADEVHDWLCKLLVVGLLANDGVSVCVYSTCSGH